MTVQPEDERYSKHSFLIPVLLIIFCFLAFAGGTVAYVTWSVSVSEHKWCSVMDLLVQAPPPKGASPSNPSRQYDVQLSKDFHALKSGLGC